MLKEQTNELKKKQQHYYDLIKRYSNIEKTPEKLKKNFHKKNLFGSYKGAQIS